MPLKTIRSRIAGTSYENADGSSRQERVELLYPGEELKLVREPDNLHDPNAIAIYCRKGYQLGYVAARVAEDLSGVLDSGGSVDAKVTAVTGGTDLAPDFGCNVNYIIHSEEGDQRYDTPPDDSAEIGRTLLLVLGIFVALLLGFCSLLF